MAESGTLLAVGAHPGAVERLCAGTLALFRRRGWRIVLASMTPGDKGPPEPESEDLAGLRREEASRSADVLGAAYHCLEWRELSVFLGDTASRKATALLRAVRPDLVITHSPLDSLSDLEQTSRVLRHACFAAPIERYDVPAFPRFEIPPPIARVPHLYYCDPSEGIDDFGRLVTPGVVVDVGPAFEEKEEVLAAHASRGEGGGALRALARARGALIGCEAGEGFSQHRGCGFPPGDPLARVLGPLVRAPRAGGEEA